jgi:hypothetical protein
MVIDTQKRLFRLAGICALIVIFIGLMDIIVTFIPDGLTPDPGKGEAIFYITLLQKNWFLGLRSLGFWNVITLLLGVPVFLSLDHLLGETDKGISKLALLFLLLGTAIYCSNNPGLPLLSISRQYSLATLETQKTLLMNAGQMFLWRGEDFTPGFFIGFFLQHLAGLMMSILMLRSLVFKKSSAVIGILGFILMSIFLVWSTFISVGYFYAMMLSIFGGILLMVWYFIIAQKLLRI